MLTVREAGMAKRPKKPAADSVPAEPTSPEPAAGPTPVGRKPNRVRSVQIGFRVTPEWRDWLAAFSDYVRKDMADTLDEALVRYARSEGFHQPPKR